MTVFIKLSKVGSVGLFSEEDGRLRQVTLISSVFSHEQNIIQCTVYA